jgi:Tol biopolymer transport system component
MWKFAQVGKPHVSPSGKYALYTVKYYNLDENKGVTILYMVNTNGKSDPVKLTDEQSNNYNPRWSSNESAIRFISDREGVPKLFEI